MQVMVRKIMYLFFHCMGAYLKENYLFQPHPLSVGWKSKRKKHPIRLDFFFTLIFYSHHHVKKKKKRIKKTCTLKTEGKNVFFSENLRKEKKADWWENVISSKGKKCLSWKSRGQKMKIFHFMESGNDNAFFNSAFLYFINHNLA